MAKNQSNSTVPAASDTSSAVLPSESTSTGGDLPAVAASAVLQPEQVAESPAAEPALHSPYEGEVVTFSRGGTYIVDVPTNKEA